MHCVRCLQYPCRCTDSPDVIAEYYAQRSPPPKPPAPDRCQICGGDVPCHCDEPDGIP